MSPIPLPAHDPLGPPLIELLHVSKRYALPHTTVAALEDINLQVSRREYVAVTGTSGSGKSSLLSILGVLDLPTEGHYLLEGVDITRLPDRELARIRNRHFGFVFQAYNLFADLTALENVEVPLLYAGVPARQRRQRARAQLEWVGMSARERHFPSQLSGGEQQRVALARALVTEPSVLLADEPTGNLSREGSEVILQHLRALHHGGMTIIVVTHAPEVAQQAGRVIEMRSGQLLGSMLPPTVATADLPVSRTPG